MSLTDFVSVASHKGVLRNLLRWDLVKFAFKRLPIYEKLQVLVESTALSVGAVAVERMYRMHNYSALANLTRSALSREQRDFVHFVEEHENVTRLLLPFMVQPVNGFAPTPIVAAAAPGETAEKGEAGQQQQQQPPPEPELNFVRRRRRGQPAPNARKLLQDLPEDDPISAYSTLTASIESFSNIPLEDTIAETWLEGPGWPPRFTYWEQEDPCVLGRGLVDAAVDSVVVLREYYTGPAYKDRVDKPPWDLKHNFPKVYNGTPPVNETQRGYNVERQRLERRINSENSEPVACTTLILHIRPCLPPTARRCRIRGLGSRVARWGPRTHCRGSCAIRLSTPVCCCTPPQTVPTRC